MEFLPLVLRGGWDDLPLRRIKDWITPSEAAMFPAAEVEAPPATAVTAAAPATALPSVENRLDIPPTPGTEEETLSMGE